MNSGKLFQRLDPFGIIAVILPFHLYLMTLAPSVTFFDSGEFITAIYSLGSAHSPGYPSFVNFVKPFTWLPFGSIAFRVNFATAFSSALACSMVYLLVVRLLAAEEQGDSTIPSFYCRMTALAAALTFAFSARLWLQTNHDKPYPLVAFLAGIVFYLLVEWRDLYRRGEERPSYIYLGAFLCGIAFGAHQTTILLVPSYIFLILSVDWRLIKRVKEIVLASAFAVFGLSLHLHLPVRAITNPALNWGDPRSFEQFMWHLLRQGYPVEKPDRDLSLLLHQLRAFNIPHEYTVVGLIFLVVGIIAFWGKRRDEVLAYFVGIISFLLVIVGFFNTPLEFVFLTEEFFSPLYLLSAVFIGLGLYSALNRVVLLVPAALLRSLPVKALAAIILLALPASVCALHYVENDQHENYVAHDYAANTLRSLPQGAVLYTWGDSGAFPLWYLQGVEKMREDLDILHTPHLVFTWYLDAFPHLFRNSSLRTITSDAVDPESLLKLSIAEMIGHRSVFIDFSTRYSVRIDDYQLTQRGICFQLAPGATPFTPPDQSLWTLYILRGLDGAMFFRDLDTSKAILIYAYSHMDSGELLLRIGKRDAGLAELHAAEKISPELAGQINQIILRQNR